MNNSKDNGKITPREVFETLWKCRDFELTHCWQRSIFLTTFLLACYAGYGKVLLLAFEKKSLNGLAGLSSLNGCSFLIALIGITLSVLWIQMGKASKAWYECYEKAIVAFSDQRQYFANGVGNVSGFKYRDIPGYKSDLVSDWLWSTSGGGYSPSKINIAIGHLSLLIWLVAAIVHLVVAVDADSNGDWVDILKAWIVEPAHMGLLFVLTLLGLWLYTLVCLKSRWLNESDNRKSGHFQS